MLKFSYLFLMSFLLFSCKSDENGNKVNKSSTDVSPSSNILVNNPFSPVATSDLNVPESKSNNTVSTPAVVPVSQLKCQDGYVAVKGNSELGTKDFCVMQFHARNLNNSPDSNPKNKNLWTNVTLDEAITACQSKGSDFDLISNPEWMTIARDIESVATNWSSGLVGTGMLNQGLFTNSLLKYPKAQDRAYFDWNDDYSGTGFDKSATVGNGWEQKRSHVLTSGNKIWDMGGFLFSYVTWKNSFEKHGPTECSTRSSYIVDGGKTVGSGVSELRNLKCSQLSEGEYMPKNKGLFAKNGIGASLAANTIGKASTIFRGGTYGSYTNIPSNTGSPIFTQGVFGLYFYNNNGKYGDIGFRCVQRIR